MAKRQRAEIDEEAIRRMMSGDIPRVENPAPQATPQPTDELPAAEPAEETAQESQLLRPKKRRTEKDYAELFLHKREGARKRQTYVNLQIYTKLAAILAVVANDLTVPTFIDNVLTLHLEQYSEELNTLYEKQFKKPF